MNITPTERRILQHCDAIQDRAERILNWIEQLDDENQKLGISQDTLAIKIATRDIRRRLCGEEPQPK